MPSRVRHQDDPNISRLANDVERIRRDADGDTAGVKARLSALERYLTVDLYPWLVLVEATVATGTDPPEPHF